MFEDSTFESAGKIHTRSRGWMIATFAFNSAILVALIFIPLIYPEALPKLQSIVLMEAPTAPVEEVKPVVQQQHPSSAPREYQAGELIVPSIIPKDPYIPNRPEDATPDTAVALGGGSEGAASLDNIFGGHNSQPILRPAVKPTQHVSTGVMMGYLIFKAVPTYPAIARAVHLGGRVVLQATISKNGAIENLHVLSGPAMLQQAAIDAVQQWRYRPYLLNGDPVEVETTVNVDFTLN